MPKFKVTYEYRGKATVEVEAQNANEAEIRGRVEADEAVLSNFCWWNSTTREVVSE